MYYGISILLVGKQYNVLWYFNTTGRKAVECTMVFPYYRKESSIMFYGITTGKKATTGNFTRETNGV